jgi:hypothetical protein
MRGIELFAGAGGLGLGVSQAGFTAEHVIEWDRYCCDTIRENQQRKLAPVSGWPLFEGDVRDFDFAPFEDKLDLVSGGRLVSRFRWAVSTVPTMTLAICFRRLCGQCANVDHVRSFLKT